MAAALGAKPPRHIPAWLGRLLTRVFASKEAAEIVVMMMEDSRAASNAKAKRELGWQPYYSSWRTGIREGLGAAPIVDLGPLDRATV
jgi:nucleoside-diphosphate-sugar epimerase